MANILIIGAGWLGLPLAQALSIEGHTVTVTRTSQSRLDDIQIPLINKALLDLSTAQAEQELAQLLDDYAITHVIGSFPPGFRKGYGQEYAEQWNKLVRAAKYRPIDKLVMISSTTVYPNLPGEMREQDAALAQAQGNPHFSDNARIMLQAEQYVIDSGIDYAILRCSGLFGPDRHPSRFATRLSQVSRKAPANMLHQDDAVAASIFALQHLHNQVVNVTTPNTVSKAEFYQAAILQAQLETPLPPVTDTADKRIVADKLIALGYDFRFNSTLDAL
ncbi:NAD-dependent epimerase/dehydratase family protein [Vibrio sp. CAU 1672]|uniref:NAD-dependent epimerase/dehydratase family protein n=1 Tax=Vibrio sp. CAU 1672 TaxID=3032594 RepID=UPI0023DBF660|nr:NAD-dependent epimerase/dehydratase family protein [Vibrio sp. CAU 1672]MDF2152464.1 NAD-dependent epimerase/dehydratase family protein [Vibrio sp. CAU 1672]